MSTAIKVSRNPKVGDSLESTLNTSTYVTETAVTDSYIVQFASSSATPVDAANATDGTTAIPAIGSTYPGLSSLICYRVNPKRRVDAPKVYDVDVEWKNLVPQGTGARWAINISVRPIRYEQDAWVDKTPTTPQNIFNSAGQPYNPTLKKIYFDEEINVSFDCGATEAASILTNTGDGVTSGCKGHYNDADLTLTVNGVARTFLRATLLYSAPEYSTIYVGGPPYDWKFALSFQYRVDGWLDKVPDRGTYKVTDLGAGASPRYQKQVFTDAFGTPVSEPILMNKAGDKLADVAPGSTQTPLFYTYDMYGAASFTALLAGIS